MHFPEIEWKPLPRIQFFAWIIFYAVLLCFLAANFSTPTLLDNLHLVTHEAGHLLFRWFGETAELWGGTILQLLVPALLGVAFVVRAELPGVAFSDLLISMKSRRSDFERKGQVRTRKNRLCGVEFRQ